MSVGSPVHQLFLQSMMSEGVLTMEETKELYKRAARACRGELVGRWLMPLCAHGVAVGRGGGVGRE